jgi:hypothetical protein
VKQNMVQIYKKIRNKILEVFGHFWSILQNQDLSRHYDACFQSFQLQNDANFIIGLH